MKIRYNRLFYFFLLLFFSKTSIAQSVKVNLVYDTSNHLLILKTKVLLIQESSTIVKKITDSFLVKPNVVFTISFSNPDLLMKDFKKISISRDTSLVINNNTLSEVIIKSKKNIVSQNLDGFSYFPQQDTVMYKKSIAFALQRMPFVSLIGKSLIYKNEEKIKFLINGKERRGIGDNWNDILENIPTEKILRVDLNTEPTLRFKEEGYSAVINILTLDANIKGSSGGVGLIFDSRRNINSNGYFTFLNKRSDLSIRFSKVKDRLDNYRIFRTKDNVTNTILALDSTLFTVKTNFFNGRVDYGVRIDSAHDFNFSFAYTSSSKIGNNLNLLNLPFERANSSLNTNDNSYNFQLGYSVTKRKGISSSFALLGGINKDKQFNNIGFINKLFSDSITNINYSLPYQISGKYNLQNIKNSKFKYEFGLQSYIKNYNTDYNQFKRQINGMNSLVLSKNDSLLQNQISVKPYFSFTKNLSQKSSLRVDLFSELFSVKNKKRNGDIYFLPETRIRYSKIISKTSTFASSGSCSFRKPNIDYLNPLIVTDNPLFSRLGNINLRPEKNINLTVELNKRGKIFTSNMLYFSYSYDLINQYNVFQNGNFIASANNGSSSYFLAYYLRLQGNIKSKFFYSINPSAGYSYLKNSVYASSYGGFIWSISSNGNYSIKSIGSVGYNCFINGRRNSAQGYNFGTVMYNVAYNRGIIKNKFFVGIEADNFLEKDRFAKSLVTTTSVTNINTTIIPNRLFNISIGYNFNKIKFAKFAKKASVDVNDQVERVR